MDLSPELPKEIKHRIISLLWDKEDARTSILSKSWKLAWDSRPVVDFTEVNYPKGSFADFLDQSLQRFSDRGVSSVEELKVRMRPNPSPETLDAVSRWLRFASKLNLKVLKLSIQNSFASNSMLDALSSGTLTTLYLSGCELTLSPGRNWRLPRLRSLSLVMMVLDSAAVEELVAACPSLEEFDLCVSCGTITSLELSGVGKLKRANVNLNQGFRKIALLGALSLESFTCYGDMITFDRRPVFDIKLEGCEASLKELRLTDINLSTEWVRSQISKSRNLKVFALERIMGLTMLKISSTELTELASYIY